MILSVIVAIAENRAIGCHNKLLWHISEDLKRFKRVTMGCPIVMGRKTFESIGRALPGRRNIVITRNKEYAVEGIEVVYSLDEALRVTAQETEVFIIGGGEIYAQGLPLADRLYLTEVAQSPVGDTFFPEISAEQWRETAREDHDGYSFIDYERKA